MAITRVQQSQISGSLSFNDKLSAGSGLAGKASLADDLNSLRSQLNRVIGSDYWYSEISGSQSLAAVYGAVHVTGTAADFQGSLDVTGVATFDSAITGSAGLKLAGDLDVNSSADFQLGVNMQSTLNVSGKADFADIVDVAGTLSASAVKIDGDVAQRLYIVDADGSIKDESNLTFDGSKLSVTGGVDASGTVEANEIKIDGDTAKRLYIVGASGEIKDEANLVFDGSMLQVTGSLDVSSALDVHGAAHLYSTLEVDALATFDAGISVTSGGMEIAGDKLELTGSLLVKGDSTLDGKLTVSGVADFNGNVTANKISIDSDVAQHLYIVDSDGSIKDEANLWFDGSKLYVTGSVEVSSDLEVKGGDITMSNSVSLASSAANKLVITASDVVQVSGDFEVQGGKITLTNGATIDSETAGSLILTEDLVKTSGDLEVQGGKITLTNGSTIDSETAGKLILTEDLVELSGDLKVSGNEIQSSTGAVVLELNGDDAFFKSDVHVAGDLYVKGAMTYIETENLKVKDAFIHLATGSNGSVNSGIVLHGGAGASDDLMLAQDGGAGEFVFAKVPQADHADVDGDNSVTVNGASLVAAWMNEIKLGGVEGSLSGSLAAMAGTGDIKLKAVNDLALESNGTAIDLASSADWTTFASGLNSSSIVGALNTLYAAGAGGQKKGTFAGSAVSSSELDFSSLGTLNVADQKFVDVYLNGVLMAYGYDITTVAAGKVTFAGSLSFIADDVITVVLRGAA